MTKTDSPECLVPVIDLTGFRDGSAKERIARQVDDACRAIGFLVVTGHGVPENAVDDVLSTARHFF